MGLQSVRSHYNLTVSIVVWRCYRCIIALLLLVRLRLMLVSGRMVIDEPVAGIAERCLRKVAIEADLRAIVGWVAFWCQYIWRIDGARQAFGLEYVAFVILWISVSDRDHSIVEHILLPVDGRGCGSVR